MSINCKHYRTAETECGVCYPCIVTTLRAELAATQGREERLRAVVAGMSPALLRAASLPKYADNVEAALAEKPEGSGR